MHIQLCHVSYSTSGFASGIPGTSYYSCLTALQHTSSLKCERWKLLSVITNALHVWLSECVSLETRHWDLKYFLCSWQIETCRRVENVLGRHDRSETKLTVLPYHAALSQEARLESMQQFLESQPKKNLFLVCTDR